MQIELFLLIGVLHGNRIKLSPLSLHSTVCFKLINKIKIFPQLHNQESGREKKRSALQLWSFKKYSWSQFLYVIFKIQISSLNEQDSYIFCQMITELMMYIYLSIASLDWQSLACRFSFSIFSSFEMSNFCYHYL